MPMLQATARMALLPMGVPISSPRSVTMTGVKGWYSANQRSKVGIESVGTNPLPKNGRSTKGTGRLLAVSTLSVDMPSATVSQVRANEALRAQRSKLSRSPWPSWAHSQLAQASAQKMVQGHRHVGVEVCVHAQGHLGLSASGLSAPIIVTSLAQLLSMCGAPFPPDEQEERTDECAVRSRVSGESSY
jgi:hypothetical protein